MTPRAALTKHLLDGDDSIFTGKFDKPDNTARSAGSAPTPTPPTPTPAPKQPLATPFDSDAT